MSLRETHEYSHTSTSWGAETIIHSRFQHNMASSGTFLTLDSVRALPWLHGAMPLPASMDVVTSVKSLTLVFHLLPAHMLNS